MRKHFFSLFVLCILAQFSWAVDQSYYSSINNKQGSTLRDNLYTITCAGPTGMSYDGLWEAYKTSDVYPADSVGKAGKIWDMYSNVLWTPGQKQCGNYSNVGSCYNREHSVPKSWFNEAKPAYYDLGHIVPTDGYVNNQRGNNPIGECEGGTRLTNGSYRATGRLGSSTFSGYTSVGTVFEPDDQYKGDFARMYMYMAVRYKKGNKDNVSISSEMYNTTDANYGFTAYSVALLMKWHRNDPVSRKEVDRNNGMQSEQGNRNPFVDYPALAEYLWGTKTSDTFSFNDVVGSFESDFIWEESDGFKTSGPRITLSTTSLTMDATAPNSSSTKTFTVTGADLTSGISITNTSGDGCFSMSPSSITSGYNSTRTITVTYSPTSEGNHTATFTIASNGASSKTITVSGKCTSVYTATWMANGSSIGTTTAESGHSPSVPSNPADCSGTNGKKFVGWTAQTSVSGNSAPTDMFTTTAPALTGDKTFYAVYANASGSTASSIEKTITFSEQGYTNGAAITTATMGNCTLTFDKGTGSNAPAYYTSGEAIRCYKGNTLTISSDNTISSIVVSTASGYAGTISANVGTYSGGTWTGSSNSVTLTHSPSNTNQWRITAITVTTGGGSTTTYSNYSLSCTTCSSYTTPTASFASATKSTTCGGSVSNILNTVSSGAVTYSSSDESVATVTNSGAVTALKAGTTTITANIGAIDCYNATSASYTLTVTRQSASASFNNPTITVQEGASVTNKVTTEADGTVSYSSSNTSVATVDNNGVVTGVSAGTTIISATVAQGNCYNAITTPASYNLTVTAVPHCTVTWHVGSTTTPVDYVQGTTLEMPSFTPGNCSDSRVFVGWSSDGSYSGSTAPSDLFTSALGTVNANADYYAIYADVAGSGSGGSTKVTFTPGTDTGTTSVTKSGVTCTMSTMNNTSYYQIYANGTGTFSSTAGDITKIEFTCTANGTSKYGPGNVTANGGSYSYEGANGTWTGSASEVQLSSTAQVRMTTLAITIGSGGSSYTNYSTECTAEEYTVTFYNNNTLFDTQTGTAGTSIYIATPSLTDCDDYTFVGWSTQNYAVDNTTMPSTQTITSIPTGGGTYYAVYSKTETTGGSGSGSGTTTMAKASSIAAGDKVVFVCEGATTELSSFTTSGTIYGVGSSYSGTPAGTMTFDVVAGNSTGTYAFKNASNYVYWTTGNSLNVTTTLSDNTSWSVTIDSNGNATILNAADNARQIWWNVSNPRFACYTGKTAGTGYYSIQLYKVTTSGGGGSTTTTYYTTAPECSCEATITIKAGEGGSVEFTE